MNETFPTKEWARGLLKMARGRAGVWTAASRTRDDDARGPSRVLIGRSAAIVFLASGIAIMVSPVLPRPPGMNVAAVALIGLLSSAIGVLGWLAPWVKIARDKTLWLIPLALTIGAANDVASGGEPFRYSLMFLATFAWLGYTHRRGTSLLCAPLLVPAFTVPLVILGHRDPVTFSAVIYTVPVCIVLGETLAWVSVRVTALQQAVASKQAQLSVITNAVRDMISVLSVDGLFEYASQSYKAVAGYEPRDLIGTEAAAYLHPDDREATLTHLREGLLAGRETSVECRFRRADGSYLWTEGLATPVKGADGLPRAVISSRDITERRTMSELLTRQAHYDALTGLPNRVLFQERLSAALARVQTRDDRAPQSAALPPQVAVLSLDLDRFKIVNDSMGHSVGDHLLDAVGQRLSALLEPGDVVARQGSDEFMLLLDSIAGPEEALARATTIQEHLRAPYLLDGRETFSTVSIGVALSSSTRSAGLLIEQADLALHQAKTTGRRRVIAFEPEMNAIITQKLLLENGLRQAIKEEQFVVYYQPKVNLTTGRMSAVEALVRWRHPTRGLLPPGEFVPLAEETGLIVPIGKLVLNEACRQAHAWRRAYPDSPPLIVCVNLSALQFARGDLVESVSEALKASGLEPHLLELEITESVVMEDIEATIELLHALRALGVLLAIDDFGLGYSSLGYLKQFAVHYLKIDASFTAGLGDDPRDTVIVSAMIALAHALGLRVTAEGVKTEEHVDRLRRLHCDLGQGHYFAPALPEDRIAALIASGASSINLGTLASDEASDKGR